MAFGSANTKINSQSGSTAREFQVKKVMAQ
jgi:hypothetical protein